MHELDELGNPAQIALQDVREYTVSEVSGLVKKTVESAFPYISIRGEISGLKATTSGHVYFSLKDNQAVLTSVCWRSVFQCLRWKPEEGLEVVCSGTISTYSGQSRYQLVVKSIRPAGVGALMALLEKRKKLLEGEGLFDPSHKRSLPTFPKKIGVITSATGAVLHDILCRLKERIPVDVVVWPVLVQGDLCARQVIEAIVGFNAMNDKPSVIIVARGGGSIEDLYCFNDEALVRAAFASEIPIVSAIGHETDYTLLDYVADVRAPTPTAAVEIVVPLVSTFLSQIEEARDRIARAVVSVIDRYCVVLATCDAIKSFVKVPLTEKLHRVDQAAAAARSALSNKLSRAERTFLNCQASVQRPLAKLESKLFAMERATTQIANAIRSRTVQCTHALELVVRVMESLDYRNVLKRGFSIVRSMNGSVIANANQVGTNTDGLIEFMDGQVPIKFVRKQAEKSG